MGDQARAGPQAFLPPGTGEALLPFTRRASEGLS